MFCNMWRKNILHGFGEVEYFIHLEVLINLKSEKVYIRWFYKTDPNSIFAIAILYL